MTGTLRQPEATRPPWLTAGVVTGVAWIPIGLALAFVSAQVGAPTASGWLFLVAGVVPFVIVGRRVALRGWRSWTAAGLAAVGCLWLIGGALIFLWALAGFPGMPAPR